jgi:hypothetical protein
VDKEKKPTDTVAEDYIYFVAKTAVPKAMSMKEIERESENDPEIRNVRQCILTDKWENCPIASYRAVRSELTCLGNIVIRGTRIVIPKSLRHQVLELAHEGHQGIVKTKQRLRTKVWWPGIDAEAEKKCRCNGSAVDG